MKRQTMWITVFAVTLLLIVSATVVSAARGDSYYTAPLLTDQPVKDTLAPGQSMWYKFEAQTEYSWAQYRHDQRVGNPVEERTFRLEYSDAWTPQVAHNVGFRLYDPYRADLLAKGIVLEKYTNEHGVVIHPVGYWQTSSFEWKEGAEARAEAEKIDVVPGLPKTWAGVLNDQGTYYIEVYNDAPVSVTYTLWMGTQVVQWAPEQ